MIAILIASIASPIGALLLNPQVLQFFSESRPHSAGLVCETSAELPTAYLGGRSQFHLEFRNTFEQTLRVIEVKGDCGCMSTVGSAEAVPPGGILRVDGGIKSPTMEKVVRTAVRVRFSVGDGPEQQSRHQLRQRFKSRVRTETSAIAGTERRRLIIQNVAPTEVSVKLMTAARGEAEILLEETHFAPGAQVTWEVDSDRIRQDLRSAWLSVNGGVELRLVNLPLTPRDRLEPVRDVIVLGVLPKQLQDPAQASEVVAEFRGILSSGYSIDVPRCPSMLSWSGAATASDRIHRLSFTVLEAGRDAPGREELRVAVKDPTGATVSECSVSVIYVVRPD
jgi:hypothetical protein